MFSSQFATVQRPLCLLTQFNHFTQSRLWKVAKISRTYSSEKQTELRHFPCYCFEWHRSSPVRVGSLVFFQTGLDTQVLTHRAVCRGLYLQSLALAGLISERLLNVSGPLGKFQRALGEGWGGRHSRGDGCGQERGARAASTC